MRNKLIGKILNKVFLSDNRAAIKFIVDGGAEIIARADGDCCSATWIEGVESPRQVLGAVVTNVEDLDMPEIPYNKREHDVIVFYGCKISTDKGSFVIDYRNESNGYYGGSLKWDDEYFYGGVSGQNGQIDGVKWIEVL